MNPDVLSEVLSSKARLRIADAISVRPRTLGELSSLSGISVQGVLRHLNRLAGLGLVEERNLASGAPKARKVYAARGTTLADYSTAGLTIVKATERMPTPGHTSPESRDLERMSGELLMRRRRIAEGARKLGRMMDDLVDEQEALVSALDSLVLDERQRLVLQVLLTEETRAEGERVLAQHYGIVDRRSIDEALARAK